MENKVCFLFGHATAPYETTFFVEDAAARHYLEYGIRTFIVGNRGDFDNYAATAIKSLKQRYRDITLTLLLAYHPAERPIELTEGFDGSFYPPLENIPRRYAIAQANRFMVNTSDSIICYVNHFGNTRNLLEYAQRQQRKRKFIIENVGAGTTPTSTSPGRIAENIGKPHSQLSATEAKESPADIAST